ncbi:MAG: hypothetical protein H7123_05455, partial [Thermoleophilia bacterium]|nr:hypothetical protein [Thermoleophilia bacterium]
MPAFSSATSLSQLFSRPVPGSKLLHPRVAGDQGVQPQEARTATQVTRELLAAPGTQLIATVRNTTYELRSADGYVRWQRYAQPDGTLAYRQTSQHGAPVV